MSKWVNCSPLVAALVVVIVVVIVVDVVSVRCGPSTRI